MKQYEMFELKLNGSRPEGSEALADVSAQFSCEGESWDVKGFYDGNGAYKVRFLPQKTGNYTWKITGAVSAEGSETCTASEKSHGMVCVEGNHFRYQDGTKYLPFGTTVYALVHQNEEIIQETMETLAKAPFNKVRHCIFPKSYDFNHNDPEYYPFEKDENGKWDVNSPCYAYWAHLEKNIVKLGEMGIQSDLILLHSYDRWGFALLSMEEIAVYITYALRRLAAYPYIWWSMANEYDFLFNHKMEDWYEIEEMITANDPYHHLLSNHNGVKIYDFSRPAITHCSLQTNAMHKAEDWWKQYKKPVIFDECCYEGNIEHEWGSISAFEMVNRFWKACVQGAFATHGETYYSEDEVLWWAKGGRLHGESSERIAFLKNIMYSLEGPLESWGEPLYDEFFNITEKADPDGEGGFFKVFGSLTVEEAENLKWKNAAYTGHYKNNIYIKYFGSQCPAIAAIRLPKEHSYKVEVIDVWEMTRKTAEEAGSGKVMLHLPGKEGIAVLATRVE
ncbi:MAG: DUF4038 domain-containing protein [Eubacteriales bacterium]|nr:DUF4038 domain-containing protein [Eubacteriales bacterium]